MTAILPTLVDVDRYLDGVPCWIDLPGDPAFYEALFGWEVTDGVARLDGQEVAGFGATTGTRSWTTAIRVTDLDRTAARIHEAGGQVLESSEPTAAGRSATVADPAGAVFRLWQAGTRGGAGLVNAPGTWNWSNLVTPDPDGAAAFYGAVFGWRRAGGMWLRPGYADRLDQLDPGRRDRHAADDIPDDFGNCVGWLLPGDTARWAVTYAVADTDKTVELAVSLGATVTVAPCTVPPVRAAELVDPQGAPFSVNTYQPVS